MELIQLLPDSCTFPQIEPIPLRYDPFDGCNVSLFRCQIGSFNDQTEASSCKKEPAKKGVIKRSIINFKLLRTTSVAGVGNVFMVPGATSEW